MNKYDKDFAAETHPVRDFPSNTSFPILRVWSVDLCQFCLLLVHTEIGAENDIFKVFFFKKIAMKYMILYFRIYNGLKKD